MNDSTIIKLAFFIYFTLFVLGWNFDFFARLFFLFNILGFIVWVVLEVKSFKLIDRGYLRLKILYTSYIGLFTLA